MKKYLAALVFVCTVFAGVLSAKPKYISPNNDGVKDELIIPISISDNRYITAWSLVITDVKGNIVRTIENSVALPEKLGFKSFFKQLVTPKQGVVIPKQIVWNGMMQNGETAPDGLYKYYVTATDDNGNVGKTKEYEVIVDTVPPQVTLTQPTDKTFGEGSKASFKIQQTGSVEDKWTGTISTANGKFVSSFTWENSAPSTFSWMGTDQNGNQVKDGIYTYEIKATDRAGNISKEAVITNIIYSADKPATNIYVVGSRYFSPETDSPNKTVTFNVTIPVPEEKTGNSLTDWNVNINKNGKPVRTFNRAKDGDIPPEKIVFDGYDDSGKLLDDGEYQATLTAQYSNGYVPIKISSPIIILDTEKPMAQISASDAVFGAGSKPSVKFTVMITASKGSPVTGWKAEIQNSTTGKTVKTYDLGAYPSSSTTITWNGLNDGGQISEKGDYNLVLYASDLAGNIGGGKLDSTVTFDTTETQLLLNTSETAFSPNNNKVKDTITFTPVTQTKDVVHYEFEILDSKNNVVYSKVENRKLPAKFVWDGKDNENILANDGLYSAKLSVIAANGSSAQAETEDFELDTIFPALDFSIPYVYFSPDGDGKQENLPISITNSTSEKLWTAEIRNSKDKVVKSFTWSGVKNELIWDGTDESGNLAENGKYSIVVYSNDKAGNSFNSEISNITLDSRETKIYLTSEYEGISPNNDNYLDSQIFKISATVAEDIASWNFDLFDEEGISVYSLSDKTVKDLPAQIGWNGADAEGNVIEGKFHAKLNVVYLKGNEVESETPEFICCATPPALRVQTAPEYFSPDNDGIDDDLYIKLTGVTMAKIESWSFVIRDPKNKVFWSTEGSTQITERIIWDGLSNVQKDSYGNAERVQSAMDYPYAFTVTDNLGMTSVFEGQIPVDVLVIREGDVLKIAVPAIIFESDSSNFQTANSRITKAQVTSNKNILNRIAIILKKFPDYQISIQGHANRVSDNLDEETMDSPVWGKALGPLSKARADAIMKYLIKQGVNSANVTTEGLGGTKPVVDPKDTDNNWKNRRVEFILVK